MKNKRITDRTSDWICMAMLLVYFLAVIIGIPFTYGINDDVAMRNIASGAVTGSPDGHLIFVRYVLGVLLSTLYRIVNGVDWYAIVWLGIILFCFGLVLYRVRALCKWKNGNPYIYTLYSIMAFTLLCLQYFVNFQFTVVAGVAGGTAMFFYYTVDPEAKKSVRIREYAIVTVLLLLTYCIRLEVFIMALPFGGLIFLFKSNIKKPERAGIFLAAAVVLVISVLIETGAYSGEDWKAFKEYDINRSYVFDFYGVPSYEEHKDFYASIGMEECDVVNLERYNLCFVDGIETGKMKQVAEYAEEQWREQNPFSVRVKAGVKLAVKGFFARENLLLNIAVKILLIYNLLWELRRRKKEWFLSLTILAVEGALWLYLGYAGRLPERVAAALLLMELLCVFSVFCQERREIKEKEPYKQKKILVMGAWILLAAASIFQYTRIRDIQIKTAESNLEKERLDHYFQENREQVFFYYTWFTAGYGENVRLFRTFEVSNAFPLGGWLRFSPLETEHLQRFGIDEVHKALVERDQTYLVMTRESSRINQYYARKNMDIEWQEVDQAPIFGSEVPVWKLQEKQE